MKEIVIRRLSLLNFKGIRDLTIDFDVNETSIYGANGAGKTTIFDAFRWVLFGKDATDRKDFNIRTLDDQGNVIPRIPHEVTACIEVDGEEINLKKCYVEKWTKKRGSAVETYCGNGVECYWNEVPCTVTEYDAKVRSLCDEQVFKLITNPLYFTSQRKDFQRTMLIQLAGDITMEDIVGDNADFAELVNHLTGKTLEEYKREVANKKRKIKDGIDSIPARIDERKRDMPEEKDWEAIGFAVKDCEQAIQRIDAQIADRSKAYTEVTKHKQDIAKELSSVRSRYTAREYELKDRLLSDYREAKRIHEKALDKVAQMLAEKRMVAISLPRVEKELEELRTKREGLITEWKQIKALTFNEPEAGTFVCPTCHRPLEADDIEARIEEMRVRFNADKAARFERNKTIGLETKQAIEAKETEIKTIKDKMFAYDTSLADMRNNPAFKDEPTEPTEAVKTALAQDATMLELAAKAKELEAELSAEVTAPDTSDLIGKKRIEQDSLDEQKAMLRDREIIEASKKRIAELEHEYQESQNELARLEGIEYTIAQFAKARIEKVESRINGLFSMVRFKMYEKQINGGEIETCEATVNGVPYSDLNTAGKINAGLDIINAICKAHGIIAPVFLDNRESVSDIITSPSQIINLVVDPSCKTLKIQ